VTIKCLPNGKLEQKKKIIIIIFHKHKLAWLAECLDHEVVKHVGPASLTMLKGDKSFKRSYNKEKLYLKSD